MKIGAILKKAYHRYLLDAMSAMALGLFSSLIIGTIIGQIAKIPFLGFLQQYGDIVSASSPVVGAAMGVAIAYGLKVKPLAMFSAAAAGAFGYQYLNAGPMGTYFAAVIGAELGNLVAGKTKLDIIVVPSVTIIAGGLVASALNPGIRVALGALQVFLSQMTLLHPIPMGMVISVVFGLALTAPISSAALAAMVFTVSETGIIDPGLALAAGAATVGCCCQMVGFAVSSWRENRMGGLIAQGVGTSMLQVGNILSHPAILIPPTLTSAILGPFATTLFQMKNASVSAGMGTSGFVGQIGTWAVMSQTEQPAVLIIKILVLHIALPAILSLAISEGMRRAGFIHEGDMALKL